MDPDALLALYRQHVARARELADGEAIAACDEFLEASTLMDDLIEWLGKGGFPPAWTGVRETPAGRPLGRLE